MHWKGARASTQARKHASAQARKCLSMLGDVLPAHGYKRSGDRHRAVGNVMELGYNGRNDMSGDL